MKKKFVLLIATAMCCFSMAGCVVVKNVGNGLTNVAYDFADKYTVGGGKVKETVDTIDLNWVSGKITVESADVDAITITEECDSTNDDFKVRHLVVDGTLRIQFSKSGKWNFNNIKKELKIVLPKDLNLDKFDMSMVSSKCKIDGLKADKLEIDGVSGDVNITNGAFKKVNLNTVSGVMDITGSIEDKLKADSVSGDVRLRLPEDTGFTAKISAVSGRFESDFDYRGEKKEFQFGDGSLDISLNAVSGSLRIMKDKK